MRAYPTATPWHCLSPDRVAQRCEAYLTQGLASEEAARRLARHGPNEIREAKRRSPWRMFLGQFNDFMILVLSAAAVIAGAIGEPADAVAILAIVVLNGIIGFVQEYRAERAMAALKRLAATSARAMRGGEVVVIPATGLVPGDLVLLEAGDAVPADLRIVEAVALQIEEAALTGESAPVEKSVAALADPDPVDQSGD